MTPMTYLMLSDLISDCSLDSFAPLIYSGLQNDQNSCKS